MSRSDFRLWVCFCDGVEGEVDFRDYLRGSGWPIARAQLNPALFALLRLDLDTVVWPNARAPARNRLRWPRPEDENPSPSRPPWSP
jgi:hypothetical protein